MAAHAEIEITASDAKLAAGLLRSRAKVNEWAAEIARGTSKAMSGVYATHTQSMKAGGFRKAAGGVFSEVAGSAQGLVTGGLVDAANGVREFERGLVRFQITANKTPESMGAMRDSIREASRATGVSSEQILEGAQAYLDITGDVEGAGRAVGKFARIAQASDSAMGDIANSAAAMQDSMKISPDELEAVFSGLINQGKAGAVTLKNMAGEFPSLLSKFARFGITGKEGVVQLGAMFQVVRKGFGSAEEASTGLQAMMAGTIKHADRFAAAGVQIFNVGKDGTKSLRPMSQIIEEIGKSKLAKDPQLLNKAFGRGEGEQAYQMLKGHVEMLREMESAGQDAGVVQRDLATFIESDAGRIDLALNRVKVALAEIFTPERITSFTNAIEGLADKIGTVADGLGKVGEGFGKLYGVGRSIRGAFSGVDENPYELQGNADMQRLREVQVKKEGGPTERMALEGRISRAAVNMAGYEGAKSSIMDAEINERSSPESLRRAAFARFNSNIGTSDVGQTYLKNAGFTTKDQQIELLNKSVTELVKQQTDAIAKVLADGLADGLARGRTLVKLGDDHVAAAVERAPKTRMAIP